MNCPHCNALLDKIDAQAVAEVMTLQVVIAELEPSDFALENVHTDILGRRTLKNFRFGDAVTVVDNRVSHGGLALDEKETLFLCQNCQTELSRETVDEWNMAARTVAS